MTAGGALIARRALSDGRTEYIVYGQQRCVYRGRMGVDDLRAFIDANIAAGERVHCVPLRAEAGGRRLLHARAREVSA